MNDAVDMIIITRQSSQIARLTWLTWGPPGSFRPKVGPMLAPWTLLSGLFCCTGYVTRVMLTLSSISMSIIILADSGSLPNTVQKILRMPGDPVQYECKLTETFMCTNKRFRSEYLKVKSHSRQNSPICIKFGYPIWNVKMKIETLNQYHPTPKTTSQKVPHSSLVVYSHLGFFFKPIVCWSINFRTNDAAASYSKVWHLILEFRGLYIGIYFVIITWTRGAIV